MLRMARRYDCVLSISTLCDKGVGSVRRTKCRYCGGSFLIRSGRWGVFAWTGRGFYRPSDALSHFSQYSKAEDEATRLGGDTHCVRWIDADDVH